MNPLSPLTYYRRHKGRALMLTALIALAVMGVYMLLGLFQESYVSPEYTINRYLRKFSLVESDPGHTVDPAVAARIGAHPDVARVLPQKNVEIAVPNVGGLAFYFRLLGLRDADVEPVLVQSGVSLAEGRLPQPGSNGVALSREIARPLGLQIGDTFDQSRDDNEFFANYADIASPLEVVGLLSGDVRLGVLSYEYLVGHESYRQQAHDGLLVIARPGREAAVDAFLQETVTDPGLEVHTRQLLEETTAAAQATLLALFLPGMLLVTMAVTLVVGAINQLAFMRRLPEFGTLHAVGRSKGWLARRLTLETAGLTVAGWVLGLLAALAGMAAVSTAVYAPQGFPFPPFQWTALLLTMPIPLAVIGFTLFTAFRALGRLDAVAIVERGELSLEKSRPGRGRIGRSRSKRSPRPLAVTTFYRRHSGRAATLIGAMALMIVGTALIVFVFDSVMDAGQPLLNNLSRTSRVSLVGVPLAEEMARIEGHPAVEHAIPAITISPLALVMPLIRDTSPLETYGLTPEDLTYLVELYGLELAEGHLPQPGSNEIVIPWTAAQNRDLQVGDVIGDPEEPIYPDAPALPAELVVSGIFARDEDVWLGFVSQAFVDADRDLWNPVLSLIVVPRAGQKAALDAWLENEIADEQRIVLTYGVQQAWITEAMNTGLFAISLMESIIALVAALALAGLNYLFVSQRRAEFGVLNALGQSRRQLVWRVMRETLFVTGIAWLVGLLGCAFILATLHYEQYAPLGLRLDFFNITPWLYTLPIPVAVFAASAGTIAWLLAKVDPVALIERRV